MESCTFVFPVDTQLTYATVRNQVFGKSKQSDAVRCGGNVNGEIAIIVGFELSLHANSITAVCSFVFVLPILSGDIK